MLYYPEGALIDTYENIAAFTSPETLKAAQKNEKILEGIAVCCDKSHNIIVSLHNDYKGIIPRNEGAVGILEGTTKDIALISRVGKPICFVIKEINSHKELILSRRRAQEKCYEHYISQLQPGNVIPAIVTHFEKYGSFVDIGCGFASLIPIASISISRIEHPSNRFTKGQNIYAVVQSIESDRKICLSHKELLGTWTENAKDFKSGETVSGIARSITKAGIFIELKPNLAGLAEYKPDVEIGNRVSVYIKKMCPEKMKAKLAIVDSFADTAPKKPEPLKYFITSGTLKHWRYSPDDCEKIIETWFDWKNKLPLPQK